MTKKKRKQRRRSGRRLLLLFVITGILIGSYGVHTLPEAANQGFGSFKRLVFRIAGTETASLEEVPEYSGQPYAVLEGDVPDFSEEDESRESFESYGRLDLLGRCTEAFANVGTELMPEEERGDISQVEPSGWQNEYYDFVDGGYVYNRCHLIGFQLTGENANERHLIIGTRYMNTEGMLPFENQVAEYVRETGNHVLFRVTPIYEGANLVASGVEMEAESVEDEGRGVQFHVYCYNVQPGVEIDYASGENWAEDEE